MAGNKAVVSADLEKAGSGCPRQIFLHSRGPCRGVALVSTVAQFDGKHMTSYVMAIIIVTKSLPIYEILAMK